MIFIGRKVVYWVNFRMSISFILISERLDFLSLCLSFKSLLSYIFVIKLKTLWIELFSCFDSIKYTFVHLLWLWYHIRCFIHSHLSPEILFVCFFKFLYGLLSLYFDFALRFDHFESFLMLLQLFQCLWLVYVFLTFHLANVFIFSFLFQICESSKVWVMCNLFSGQRSEILTNKHLAMLLQHSNMV